eukprot:s6233_g4.t1
MFGTNGFVKVSERNWGRPAASEGLRKIRSDPVLPRIAEGQGRVLASARKVSIDAADGSLPHVSGGLVAKRATAFRHATSLLPPASVEEATNAALASIEDIRSSVEHFQGRSNGDKEAFLDEPTDLREDLRYRLARYRYARRIEPPPPPLAMDPAFGPAPPRPVQVAAAQAQIMSSSCLRSFQPDRRRAQLAEQAEHRRLRLEAAKTKRELSHQEVEEKTLADIDRYLQRMEHYELEKNSSRSGGRRRPLASLTLEQQLQERQKQFATIMAAAAFCAGAVKAMAGFGPISQACLSRFNRISVQEKGTAARPFACAVAINLWRSHYAEAVRVRLTCKLQEASPLSEASPTQSSPTRSPSRRSLKESADRGIMQMQLPLLEKSEALPFMWRCQLMEDMVVNRLRLRRARGHARCLLAALRCWHPFRALRMVRDVMAKIRRLQDFLRSALIRLKATRVALKVQMLQIERDLIEKELDEEPKEAKDSKDLCRRMSYKAVDQKTQDQTKALLPDTWRTQAVNSLLRLRRHEQLQLLQEWRMDMATYRWEVQEWRRARSALTCPIMPPYPTHVPRSKELAMIICEARRKCSWVHICWRFAIMYMMPGLLVWLANFWENIWEAATNGSHVWGDSKRR